VAVARLAKRDYVGVLDVLGEAAAIDGPIAFPRPVLAALRRLVPSDVVAYHEGVEGRPRVIWEGEPRGPVTAAVRAGQRRYAAEDALTPTAGARKYSDYLSARQFHRLGFYWEVARPLGVEDMFRLWLEPDGSCGARLEFDRPDRGFSERDRDVLDLLLPHLRQIRLNALRRRRVTEHAGLVTVREREIVELVAEGRTNREIARALWISAGTVRKHLENVYEKLGVHTRTAAAAALFGASVPDATACGCGDRPKVRELFGIDDRADGLDEATGDLEWHDGAGASLGVL
jgi:DNA-binding CsgD family transcriptional regulator